MSRRTDDPSVCSPRFDRAQIRLSTMVSLVQTEAPSDFSDGRLEGTLSDLTIRLALWSSPRLGLSRLR